MPTLRGGKKIPVEEERLVKSVDDVMLTLPPRHLGGRRRRGECGAGAAVLLGLLVGRCFLEVDGASTFSLQLPASFCGSEEFGHPFTSHPQQSGGMTSE
jgi:hypothetical protein